MYMYYRDYLTTEDRAMAQRIAERTGMVEGVVADLIAHQREREQAARDAEITAAWRRATCPEE